MPLCLWSGKPDRLLVRWPLTQDNMSLRTGLRSGLTSVCQYSHLISFPHQICIGSVEISVLAWDDQQRSLTANQLLHQRISMAASSLVFVNGYQLADKICKIETRTHNMLFTHSASYCLIAE